MSEKLQLFTAIEPEDQTTAAIRNIIQGAIGKGLSPDATAQLLDKLGGERLDR